MDIVLAIGFLAAVFYYLLQFAQKEEIEEEFEDTIIDIEGRLEWARSRKAFPFGMRAQLDVSCELLGEAKGLWNENKWHQAYRVARQSQSAMDRAQNIYVSFLKKR